MVKVKNFGVRLAYGYQRMRRDFNWALQQSDHFLKGVTGSRILVYHGVCQDQPFRYNTLFITQRRFEQHLIFFKKYFNVVSLNDFYQGNYRDDRFTVCLTFDDGFANNYKHVLPLLEQYQVPATFFVTGIRHADYNVLWNDAIAVAQRHGPGSFYWRNEKFSRGKDRKYLSSKGDSLVDLLRKAGVKEKMEVVDMFSRCRSSKYEDYWLQMSVEQIRALSCSKWVSVGSHGYYHSDLTLLTIADLKEELSASKKFLESVTGKPVESLAFPYGAYNENVLREARHAGYTKLLATEAPVVAGEKDLMPRLTINPFITTINQLYATISGNYQG